MFLYIWIHFLLAKATKSVSSTHSGERTISSSVYASSFSHFELEPISRLHFVGPQTEEKYRQQEAGSLDSFVTSVLIKSQENQMDLWKVFTYNENLPIHRIEFLYFKCPLQDALNTFSFLNLLIKKWNQVTHIHPKISLVCTIGTWETTWCFCCCNDTIKALDVLLLLRREKEYNDKSNNRKIILVLMWKTTNLHLLQAVYSMQYLAKKIRIRLQA